MNRIAVLGAGAGGLSATVDLTLAGHQVALWNRNAATLRSNAAEGVVRYRGVFGEGEVRPALITSDLNHALAKADVAVVCLPGMAHGPLFNDLAALGSSVPLILNPGHTGGALHARRVWCQTKAELPPIAELSTLTYVARVIDGVVHTTGKAKAVRAAGLPGSDYALAWAHRLFPCTRAIDVLETSLSNVNLVLHPPGAVLGLAWVEATGGDFRFYADGTTPAVAAVRAALDPERRLVATEFGHPLPPLGEEMAAVGTIDQKVRASDDPAALIREGRANQHIRAPGSTSHRYYREDFPFALQPFTVLAELAGVAVPTAQALLTIGACVLGTEAMDAGFTAERLGVAKLSAQQLIEVIRE